MRIRLISMLLLTAAVAFAQRPEGLSVYTWDREDIFAGPLRNDLNQMNVGMNKLEEILKENPKDPDAMALKAMGLTHLAVRAHEDDDAEGFRTQYGQALRLLDEALTIDPRGIGVNAVYGGTMLLNQGRLPSQHRQRALEAARDAYNVLYEEQGAQLENMPLHHQGEVLAGVAESEFRLGNRERADVFMKRIVQTMSGTAYARRAETWLSDPDAVNLRSKLVCQSCHEAGRLSNVPGR